MQQAIKLQTTLASQEKNLRLLVREFELQEGNQIHLYIHLSDSIVYLSDSLHYIHLYIHLSYSYILLSEGTGTI